MANSSLIHIKTDKLLFVRVIFNSPNSSYHNAFHIKVIFINCRDLKASGSEKILPLGVKKAGCRI
jgi:hypothetical protein